MALDKVHKYTSQIEQDEHDDTANVELKKSGEYGWDADNLQWVRMPITNGKLDVNATISTTGLATDTNQTNGAQKSQIVDAGGEAVTVTGGKLDVNASVDTTGLALDATLTGGTQKSQIVDAGGEAVTVTGGKLDVNATASLAGVALPISGATDAVGVAIVDGSGNQITSFGGGTQYTQGDTDASITGTAILFEDTGDTLAVPSDANPFPIKDLSPTLTDGSRTIQLVDGSNTPLSTTTNVLNVNATVANLQTDALTDSQLRANPVPVSGTVTANLSTTDNDVLDAIEVDSTNISRLLGGAIDSFGHVITGEINNDVDVQFYRATSDTNLSNIITETEANGGTASRSNGMATFSTTTTSNSRAKGVSLTPVVYTAGAEVYMIFTAGFPTATGGTGSYRRIGLYNDFTDGFFIGYETTGTFGVTILKGGSATTTLQASFSNDTLVGGAGSLFTRNGTPEAIDLTKLNVFRIRFGWVGSAPIEFEVLAPDGHWIAFHTIKQPNLTALPSINTADLYTTCDVNTGTSGNTQSVITNCWGGGTTQKLRKLNETLSTNSLASLTRSVIAGETTAGGGSFVNVKVNPSGALTADVTGTVTANAGTNLNTSLLALEAGGNLAAIKAKTDNIPAQGQALAAASLPVVLPAAQVTTLTPPAAITGFALETTLGSVKTAVETIDNAIAGTEMQVDVLTMPTTTVTATNLDIRDLTSVSDSVAIGGTVAVTQSGTWDEVGINDSGNSITVDNAALAVTGGGLEATALRVTLANDSTGVVSVDDNGGVLTVDGTVTAAQATAANLNMTEANSGSIKTAVELIDNAVSGSGFNITQQGGVAISLNTGVRDAGTQRVTIATNDSVPVTFTGSTDVATQTTLAAINTKLVTGTDIGDVTINNSTGAAAVNIQDGGNTITVDGTVTVGSITAGDNNIGNVDIVTLPALAAGTNNIGDVDVLSIAAGTNKIGDVDIAPRTTGGWSVGNYTSGDTFTALTSTAQVVKGSAGKFGGYYIYNPNAAATYVIVYNIAAAGVTVGTSTPKLVFCIPASSGANLELLAGIPFDTAISVAATTTGGGNTAPTTALEAMIFYV